MSHQQLEPFSLKGHTHTPNKSPFCTNSLSFNATACLWTPAIYTRYVYYEGHNNKCINGYLYTNFYKLSKHIKISDKKGVYL